jgi:hypothetical protein
MLGLICFFIEEVYVGTPFLNKTPKSVKTFFLTISKIFLTTYGFATLKGWRVEALQRPAQLLLLVLLLEEMASRGDVTLTGDLETWSTRNGDE